MCLHYELVDILNVFIFVFKHTRASLFDKYILICICITMFALLVISRKNEQSYMSIVMSCKLNGNIYSDDAC